jgi:hypothetical protein
MSDYDETLAAGQEQNVDPLLLIAGFACGMLAGAAVAVLLAPAPGRDTRAWLAIHGRDARRRTAKFLRTDEMHAIIRKSGMLGLAEVLRRASSGADGDDVPAASV